MADRRFEERWERLRDWVEHLALEPSRGGHEGDVIWYPATDAYETEDGLVIRMDVSGVQREDVRITLRENVLHVRGVRREPRDPGRKTFHMMEVAKGPFARSIQLPQRFMGSEAEAGYQDGVLEIRVRARLGAEPREIDIKVD